MARDEQSDKLADAREIYESCDDYRDMVGPTGCALCISYELVAELKTRRRSSRGAWNWTRWERRFKRLFWFVFLSTLLFICYAIGGAIFDNMKIPIDDCDQVCHCAADQRHVTSSSPSRRATCATGTGLAASARADRVAGASCSTSCSVQPSSTAATTAMAYKSSELFSTSYPLLFIHISCLLLL